MTDFTVSARFRRQVQPVPYEAAEADITVTGTVYEGSDKAIAEVMDKAQRAVLAAVGKSHEFRPAGSAVASNAPQASVIAAASGPTSVEPQPSGTETPKAEEKKPRGRPPKAAAPTADALDAALEAATSQPEPDANKLAGAETAEVKVDEKKDLPPISDEDLQNACAAAADKIGSAKVKGLYMGSYGRPDRVAEMDADFRRPFLKDLEDLVKKTVAAKAG